MIRRSDEFFDYRGKEAWSWKYETNLWNTKLVLRDLQVRACRTVGFLAKVLAPFCVTEIASEIGGRPVAAHPTPSASRP